MGADLHEESGFADARLTGEEGNRAHEDAATEDGIEVAKLGYKAGFGVGWGDGGDFDEVEFLAGRLALFEGGFAGGYGFGELLG